MQYVTHSENGSRKKGDWLRAELPIIPGKTAKLARCLSPFLRRAKQTQYGPLEKGTGTVTPQFSPVPRVCCHGASPLFQLAFSL